MIAKRIQPITATGANNGTATTTTIHTDFLGSPVAETNSAGTVTRIERYTPYGEPADMQLDAGPGFTSHATDVATGLTYMQQRYMDQELGRFLTPDPVGPEEDFIKHFNRYNYAMNNPVRYTDPDGRQSFGYGTKQPADGIKGCNQTGSCGSPEKGTQMRNESGKQMVKTLARTAIVGAAPATLTATGVGATIATSINGAEVAAGATIYRGINAGANLIKTEIALIGESATISPAIVAAANSIVDNSAKSLASAAGGSEFVNGIADGLSDVQSPPTSTANAAGNFIGSAIKSVLNEIKK